MDPRVSIPLVPLHLTALAILSPNNAPLYVHSFTGPADELRHYHLAHAAVDVIEERNCGWKNQDEITDRAVVMSTTPTKPADSYLGLLFCMEDMAFYGFQTTTKLRMVLSIALVDAMIKDADIVAVFRAIHHLLLEAIHNPFLSLPPSFRARPAHQIPEGQEPPPPSTITGDIVNPPVKGAGLFATSPEEIQPEWLRGMEGGLEPESVSQVDLLLDLEWRSGGVELTPDR
ncbi:hypothetical protein JCM24511_04488 [Saitozyma sp. JCM 24511]|nr:hypothetical protein JCM24511_04488 [Saitozyma sp. JCM 24511]